AVSTLRVDLAGKELVGRMRCQTGWEPVAISWQPVARVICRGCDSGYKGVSGLIDCQSGNSVRCIARPVGAGEVGGVAQRGGCSKVQPRDKAVDSGLNRWPRLERSKHAVGGEVRRRGRARDVHVDAAGDPGIDGGTHPNASCEVKLRTAKIGRVEQ